MVNVNGSLVHGREREGACACACVCACGGVNPVKMVSNLHLCGRGESVHHDALHPNVSKISFVLFCHNSCFLLLDERVTSAGVFYFLCFFFSTKKSEAPFTLRSWETPAFCLLDYAPPFSVCVFDPLTRL